MNLSDVPSRMKQAQYDLNSFDVHDLLQPGVFAHPVHDPRIVETHISWIVLTGPFAYKVKKPVKLDFLDATSLARRRLLCDEEIRLNRRFASDLYLDVVPISMAGNKLTVGGQGEPIEYAVRMRQFDPEGELAQLLDNDAVSVEDVQALGRTIAGFHATAETSEWHGIAAHTLNIRDVILKNVASLTAQLGTHSASAILDSMAEWLLSVLLRKESQLRQRERSGFVRDCHGDLHAHNVVRYAGRLLPFDCLEFDPSLRFIDVIDDLAFLIMDFTTRGRSDLAHVLLSTYLKANGDYEGLQLLPLFATHRALVRAKIDVLSAHQFADRRDEFMLRFERRLRTARQWSIERAPLLVLMHGVSGSGKSWLSEQLIQTLPAIRVRSDVERKRLAGVESNVRAAAAPRSGIYTPEFERRTYDRLYDCARHGLTAGFEMIVDATFLATNERQRFHELALSLGLPCVIVHCEAPYDALVSRIESRAKSGDRTSDADRTILDHQMKSAESFSEFEAASVVTANTTDADVVTKVTAAIARQRCARA